MLFEEKSEKINFKGLKMKNMTCFICHQEVYNGLGKGCKMCGMTLEDSGKDFCCRKCKKQYLKIR